VHAIRGIIKDTMSVDSSNLVSMAAVARSSSTRAYTGHNHEMRHIFDIKNLNLTEFVRPH